MTQQRPSIHAVSAKIDMMLEMQRETKTELSKVRDSLNLKADKAELDEIRGKLFKVTAAVSAITALVTGGAKAAFGMVKGFM